MVREAGGRPKRSRAEAGSCAGQLEPPGCDYGLRRRCRSPEKILAAAAFEARGEFRDEMGRRTTKV
jgi:hypothetical protein